MSRFGLLARDVLSVSLLAVLLGLFLRTFVVQIYTVPSDSMEPLLLAGDYVLVNKLIAHAPGAPNLNPWLPQREPGRTDVLVFPHPLDSERLLIKRCLAAGGELVHIRDKALLIDHEAVFEPYVEHRDERTYSTSTFLPEEVRVRDQYGPKMVSPGGLFCLGDNRDASLDSRHWGEVEASRVVGQAVGGLRPATGLFRIR